MSDHLRVPSRREQGNNESPAVSLSPAELHTPAPQKTTDSLIQSTLYADHDVGAVPSELPESIGRFTSLHLLGHGGFGFVYRAYDPELKRLVALKAPKMGVVAEPFLEEARAAAQLKHENIVTVYDVGRSADDQIFIAMEFVDGPTLSVLMRQQSFSHVEAATLIARVARAVAFAHEAGIVHRDLKPGNILIAKDGTPKVGDFGLACYENREPLKEGEVAGTPAYMAPEQVSGTLRQIDRRTDIWALGVILYQLLSGKMPFEGSREELFDQIGNDSPKPLRSIDATIPQELESICNRCLSKSPADRLQSAQKLAQELERFCASYDETRAVSAPPLLLHDDQPAATPSRHLFWGAVLCGVLLVGWLGQSLWSGPGAGLLDMLPGEGAFVGDNEPPVPSKSAAQHLLESDRSAILESRDPRWALVGKKFTPLVWQGLEETNSWAADQATGRLAVRTRTTALFSAGRASVETASLRTSFKAQGWDGGAGLFWGLRDRTDETKTKQCFFARVGRLYDGGPFEVEVGDLELSKTPLGWMVTEDNSWFSVHPEIPKGPESTLQVDLENGALQQVLLDDEVVIRREQLPKTPMPPPSMAGHDVGVLSVGGTVLFKSIRIRE